MIYQNQRKLSELSEHLKDCPIHRWRAETNIELIHKEPTLDELKRIAGNWQLMSDDQKKLSDLKSIELFGKTNMQHLKELEKLY